MKPKKARLDLLEFKIRRNTGEPPPQKDGETDLEYFNRTMIEGYYTLEDVVAGSYTEEERTKWGLKPPRNNN